MHVSLVDKLNEMRVVLASGSEPRAKILKETKLKFEVCRPNFEENFDLNKLTISEYVEQTALGKLNDVWDRLKNDRKPPDIVISADTMVCHNGKLYGKPKTKTDAIETITSLTRTSIPSSVYTGVVVRYKDHIYKFTDVTTVHMLQLSAEEVLSYVDSGEAMGKAGGFGIQGLASTFVKRIEGDVNNVIGLPLCKLWQLLKQKLGTK